MGASFRGFVLLLVYSLSLTGCGSSSSSPAPQPTVNAPPSLLVDAAEIDLKEGETATLTAQASDPDGDALTFSWRQTGGISVEMQNADTNQISFTVPILQAESGEVLLQFEVSVADGNGGTDRKSIDASVIDTWNDPPCEHISGTRYVAFSRDGGETFIYPEEPLVDADTFTYGLTPLTEKGHLLLLNSDSTNSRVDMSKDYGCTWTRIADVRIGSAQLSVSGDVVYGWGWFDNRAFRIDTRAADADMLRLFDVDFLPDNRGLIGLGVSATNPDHLLAQDRDANFHFSEDGGDTWNKVGSIESSSSIYYDAAIQSDDLNHVILGSTRNGAWLSYDMGANWTRSSITSDTYNGSDINVFKPLISPKNPNVVWALGLNLDQSAELGIDRARHIYRSNDGGLTFQIAIDSNADEERWLTNGTFFYPSPYDTEKLFYTYFGCNVPDDEDAFNLGRTYLYFHDAASGETRTEKHKAMEGVGSIFIAPDNPDLIYVGLNTTDAC